LKGRLTYSEIVKSCLFDNFYAFDCLIEIKMGNAIKCIFNLMVPFVRIFLIPNNTPCSKLISDRPIFQFGLRLSDKSTK
jgi:hypothetical protein